ncbi:hypothetical protein IWQ61_006084 [Dispira simplex]|nr:hypothetical protein IWQ61_006084 [Dispira simplex]
MSCATAARASWLLTRHEWATNLPLIPTLTRPLSPRSLLLGGGNIQTIRNITTRGNTQKRAQQLFEKGIAHLQKGENEHAQDCFQQSASLVPSAAAYYNLGVSLYQTSQFEPAVDAWRKSLEQAPDHADAHLNLASAYFMHLKDLPRALEHLRQASELAPNDGEVFYNYGCILEAAGQLQTAVEKYRKAVELGIDKAQANLRNCTARLLKQKLAQPGSKPRSD